MNKDGGPAFPGQELSQGYANEELSRGMSLRDYFAAQVVVRYLVDYTAESAAQAAYQMADAMLKQRADGDKA